MNLIQATELINKYAKCKVCGSEEVGNGEGTVYIEKDRFIRSCKCGWKVVIELQSETE